MIPRFARFWAMRWPGSGHKIEMKIVVLTGYASITTAVAFTSSPVWL